ncbi:hypothetical protein ACHAQK_009260 [Fusarium lateritium]
MRFNSESAFCELGVPTKLKGLDIIINVILRVYTSSILSLQVIKNPSIPPAIVEEFESTALSLNLTLKCPPALIVHTGAIEPLATARKQSRVVLDAIRNLSKATALSIFIEAHKAPTNLQDISDTASQGLFKSYSTRFHITSMYGGIRGKLIDTSTETTSPPSYDEAATCPPPPPPIDEPLGKKRPRQNTDSKRNNISLL